MNIRTHFLTALTLGLVLQPLFAGEADPPGSGRLRKAADPAEALVSATLSEAGAKRLTELFERLASENFDERQEAQKAILEFGTRAAPFAKKYESSDDVETQHFARRFNQFLMLRYHGYLPVSPELKAALAAPRRVFIGKQESFRGALERLLRDSELTAAFGWKTWPERIIGGAETVELNLPTGEALQALLQPTGMIAVPRGSGIAVVSPEQAAEMCAQEHDFPTPSLPPEERERFAKALEAWLPQGMAVSVAGKNVRVKGSDAELRLAARAAYGLLPETLDLPPATAQSGVFPFAPDRAAVSALFEMLEAPVDEFKMAGIEPLRGIARLRAAGHPIVADDSDPALVPQQPAVTLELRALPLGLVLRWLAARANQPQAKNAPGTPAAAWLDLQPAMPERSDKQAVKAHIAARLLAPGKQAPLPESAGFADVAFLCAGALAAGAPPDRDATAAGELREKLESELMLYPCNESDFATRVYNRRWIVRGPAPLVARAVALVDAWRESGRPPQAKWRVEFARRLQREIEWNGSDVTGENLLPRLRDGTGINILLERENPLKSDFGIDAKDSELFPRGKHSAKELILRLCDVSKASLAVRWGAVVLTPVTDEKLGWRAENERQMAQAIQGIEIKDAEEVEKK